LGFAGGFAPRESVAPIQLAGYEDTKEGRDSYTPALACKLGLEQASIVILVTTAPEPGMVRHLTVGKRLGEGLEFTLLSVRLAPQGDL
jgi:hypothetical protein